MSHDFTDQNPYENTAGGSPKKKKSNALMIILIILGVGGVLCLLCCGGFMWFGYSAMNQGMAMFADSIRQEYGDHPAVQKHIGELESVESDLFNAAAYEGQMTPGELPFKVRGPNGEGTIIVRQGAPQANGQPGVAGGRLLLPDGEVIELDE
jgi:hypothetical protein